jgi:hypothetical protein
MGWFIKTSTGDRRLQTSKVEYIASRAPLTDTINRTYSMPVGVRLRTVAGAVHEVDLPQANTDVSERAIL